VPVSPIFSSDSSPEEVHNQGEVWCVGLWEARANLTRKHGFEAGNRLVLELGTDALNLTPPAPTFLEARDAILQADLVAHGGANRAELWAAFAKRGLGFSASRPRRSTTVGVAEALVTNFNGTVSLKAYSGGTATQIGRSSLSFDYPFGTLYEDARIQSICLAAEVGPARLLTGLGLYVVQEPAQPLNRWTIRLKHTTRLSYRRPRCSTAPGLSMENDDDANLNPDRDGSPNRQEFLAGTDPQAADSVLRIVDIAVEPFLVRVRVLTTPGKTYLLEWADDPAGGNWSAVGSAILAPGTSLEWAQQPPLAAGRSFYRVRLGP
jgi:hypothetical protein